MIEFITTPHYHPWDAIMFIVREVGVGVIVGAVGSVIVGSFAHRTSHLPAGLASVGSLAAAALAYGTVGGLHGSGFLAVNMIGLALGHQQHSNHEALIAFHQGVTSFAEIGMFFTLGLLVYPSQFGAIALKALLLTLITALVARPIAVGLVTVRQGFSPPDRALIAWAGLRGAVPVILATFAVIQGAPRSLELLNIVFFAVLLSAALEGLTIQPLARRLRRHDDT